MACYSALLKMKELRSISVGTGKNEDNSGFYGIKVGQSISSLARKDEPNKSKTLEKQIQSKYLRLSPKEVIDVPEKKIGRQKLLESKLKFKGLETKLKHFQLSNKKELASEAQVFKEDFNSKRETRKFVESTNTKTLNSFKIKFEIKSSGKATIKPLSKQVRPPSLKPIMVTPSSNTPSATYEKLARNSTGKLKFKNGFVFPVREANRVKVRELLSSKPIRLSTSIHKSHKKTDSASIGSIKTKSLAAGVIQGKVFPKYTEDLWNCSNIHNESFSTIEENNKYLLDILSNNPMKVDVVQTTSISFPESIEATESNTPICKHCCPLEKRVILSKRSHRPESNLNIKLIQ